MTKSPFVKTAAIALIVLVALIIVDSSSNKKAEPQISSSTTQMARWGAESDSEPQYFYASDVPQLARERIEETFAVARTTWGNYGPLEVWVTGQKTMPSVEFITYFCNRQSELNQQDKFECLNKNRNGWFEYSRRHIANTTKPSEYSILGQTVLEAAKYSFHQINLAEPLGFADVSSQKIGMDQVLVFHEYFHVLNDAHISNEPGKNAESNPRMALFGPRWFMEGSAVFMSLRTVSELRASGDLQLYGQPLSSFDFKTEMSLNMDRALKDLADNPDLELTSETLFDDAIPYDLGSWAVAYLLHKTGPDVLIDKFIPSLNRLGWDEDFKQTFGITPLRFYEEFDKFIHLDRASQMQILDS